MASREGCVEWTWGACLLVLPVFKCIAHEAVKDALELLWGAVCGGHRGGASLHGIEPDEESSNSSTYLLGLGPGKPHVACAEGPLDFRPVEEWTQAMGYSEAEVPDATLTMKMGWAETKHRAKPLRLVPDACTCLVGRFWETDSTSNHSESLRNLLVPRERIELPTRGFSVAILCFIDYHFSCPQTLTIRQSPLIVFHVNSPQNTLFHRKK
ncbi:MAG: hypothetical protein HY916_03120 [Desulfovibrio sp.]|nr:hypothetical protein [Desulfovibrio sp.]